MAIVATLDAGLVAASRGATIIQLRMRGATTRELESSAGRLVREAGLPVLISRRIDVAVAAGAAGVNLPEDDLPVAAARRLLGPAALVGRSVHDLSGALAAEASGASFVLFGPVFATPSHPDAPAAGLDALSAVARTLTIPVLAVGGVLSDRVAAVLGAGAAGHAAIRAYS